MAARGDIDVCGVGIAEAVHVHDPVQKISGRRGTGGRAAASVILADGSEIDGDQVIGSYVYEERSNAGIGGDGLDGRRRRRQQSGVLGPAIEYESNIVVGRA